MSFVSVAPTVITHGSFAGANSSLFGPKFPDETTTTMPAFQSWSTAASRVLVK